MRRSVGKSVLSVSVFLVGLVLVMGNSRTAEARGLYGETLCGDTVHYHCLTIDVSTVDHEILTKKGPRIVHKKILGTWEALWPDPVEREIVMKLNRMNIRLKKGMVIAVPNDMTGKTFMDFSPYPAKMDPPGRKLIIFDPALLAWAAYDPEGNLVRWGPAAGGRDYCPDIHRGCRTRTGPGRVYRKMGANYRSGKYPVGCRGSGCARMPYALFFHSGYAFHASTNVPGANASHGCVRMFYEDAKWLNLEFAEIGTRVLIKPYPPR